MQYSYRLYGMNVLSDLYFPQLCGLETEEGSGASLKAEIRSMTEEEERQFRREHGESVCGSGIGSGISWLCNRNLLLTVEQGMYLKYHIREKGNLKYVRTYLLGFGMALLCLQQGRLPFHCSALETPEGEAVLIAGESGAGKSTLTGNLLRADYRFLADDMAVVDVSREDGVWVYPAFPWMKLCRDAAVRQGYSLEQLHYIDEKKDKFLVPYTGAFRTEGVRVKQFILLGKFPENGSREVMTEKITGAESMIVYKENLFLRHLWKGQDPGIKVWQNCLKMAGRIPVYAVKRSAAGDSTARVAAEVRWLNG